MKKVERVRFVMEVLQSRFPDPEIPLVHGDAYTLLVSVLLSAQCTDKRVNEVTPELFSMAGNPEEMASLDVQTILKIVRPCGLGPSKAANIHRLSEILCERHNGKVPESFEKLEALPGIGHKSASVIMSQAFGHPAFPVDTHIHRLMYRWRLSNGRSVIQTERDAKRWFPVEKWNNLHLQMIYFGRSHCPARGHIIPECPVCSVIGCRD